MDSFASGQTAIMLVDHNVRRAVKMSPYLGRDHRKGRTRGFRWRSARADESLAWHQFLTSAARVWCKPFPMFRNLSLCESDALKPSDSRCDN